MTYSSSFRYSCALIGLAGTALAPAMAQSFFESGAAGSFSTTNWGVDRYAPAGWTPGATDPLSGTALRIDLSNADRADLRPSGYSGAFYNTQGRQRAAGITGAWEVGGELFIPSDWETAGNLRRSDLWTRDANPVEGNAFYPIVGFINNDPADGFNPLASGFSPRFRVWDSSTGWVDLATTVNYGAYNAFRIVNTTTSHDFYINGALVQSLSGAAYSEAGFEGLQTAFVEAYNFGNADNAGSLPDSGYEVYWRNVYASVPAPGAIALLGLGGLVCTRRRR
ncbi:hypothetical protein PHYC_00147 [Phycisphaerales bacterium]|nr:hypothetical protein PHYC_00147 [Phycisphaerales bacterium]